MKRSMGTRFQATGCAIFLMVMVASVQFVQANPIAVNTVRTLVSQRDYAAIKQLGPAVLQVLVSLYERSDVAERTMIAETFYNLGWKSPDAKRVMMQDVHTPDGGLRLQVQWALGRVSNDPDVVQVLLENLRFDEHPLFRDKAACALASDQIHLAPEQKVQLYDGLILALGDNKADVRDIAIKALEIQTGQRKGYSPDAPINERMQTIRQWRRWLEEYKSNL